MVESTGGDIVHYFTVPGYRDPVDQLAIGGLAASAIVIRGSVWILRRPPRRRLAYDPIQEIDSLIYLVRSRAGRSEEPERDSEGG